MSIWSSVAGPDVLALYNGTDATNYRGEGEPDYVVDVATARPWHGLIRLAWYRPDGSDGDELLLSAGAARDLAAKLLEVAGGGP